MDAEAPESQSHLSGVMSLILMAQPSLTATDAVLMCATVAFSAFSLLVPCLTGLLCSTQQQLMVWLGLKQWLQFGLGWPLLPPMDRLVLEVNNGFLPLLAGAQPSLQRVALMVAWLM
jgi:hypothetical protein